MLKRVRAAYDGAGWFVGLASVLFAVAVLAVLLELQSPDLVLWTGQRVTGTEQGGIVYYRWHGQNYSLDVPGAGSARSVSVYLDPGDPANALLDSPANRAVADLIAAAPFLGVIGLLAAGPVRNHRRRRRRQRGVGPTGFGHGLDEDFVSQRLRELRRGGGRTRR